MNKFGGLALVPKSEIIQHNEFIDMSGLFTFLFAIWLGYVLFLYLTHPEKKKHKVPKLKIGNKVELLPNIRIHSRGKTYHIHHWAILTIVTAATLVNYEGFQYLTIIKGVAIGGIIQGLRYPDRFKFRHYHTTKQSYNLLKQPKSLPK